MRRSIPLALLALAAPLLAAQGTIPDPTDPARYFPLEVGNEWVWAVTVWDPEGEPIPDGLLALEITSDTTLGGVSYAVATEREWVVSAAGDTTRTSTERYLRFDDASARVLVRDAEGEEEIWSGTGCGLDVAYSENPGDLEQPTAPCEYDTWGLVSGGEGQRFAVGSASYTGTVKEIAQYYFVWATFVADVGQVYRQVGDFGHIRQRLSYAKVGGVEYGDRTGLQAEEPLPRPRVTSIRRAFPNPFADAFTIAVDHPRSGRVRVEVFDVLGRRVYHDEPVVPFGRTELRLDLPPGAPGVYTVRVRSAADRWPARPVRLVRIGR
jgi:hypothetical protein